MKAALDPVRGVLRDHPVLARALGKRINVNDVQVGVLNGSSLTSLSALIVGQIAPVGDSLVVLILCITVLAQYCRDFLAGLAELAGATAHPQDIASARRAIRGTLQSDGGILCDLTLTKTGRSYLAIVYYDPARPVRAEEMDHLTKTLNADIAATLTGAELCLVVTQTDRTAQMQALA